MKTNDFFDEVYCINLHDATTRWKIVNKRFQKNGIFVKRIEGVDIHNPIIRTHFNNWLNPEPIETNIKDVNFNERTLAALHSHLKCIDDAIANGYEKILIFEDDVIFHNNYEALFNESLEILPPSTEMWLLGGFQHDWTNTATVNDRFYESGNTMGLFAYALLSKESIISYRNLIRLYWDDKLCIDTIIGYIAMPHKVMDIDISYPSLVGHDTSEGSTTQNGKIEDYTGFFPKQHYEY